MRAETVSPLVVWVRRLPMKTKVVVLILITSIAALLVEGLGFIAYERVRVKDEMIRDLSSLARIIADRNTAALTFNDDAVAKETLAALKAKRVVTAACIFDAEGRIFARYDSGAESPYNFPESASRPAQAAINGAYLHLTEPIVLDGVRLGSVFIRASLGETQWDTARLGNQMVGFAHSFADDAPATWKLDKLYVHPSCQRKGGGRALLDQVKAHAASAGAGRLILRVNKHNEVALAAYAKYGFRVYGDHVLDIGNEFVMDDYLLELTLCS